MTALWLLAFIVHSWCILCHGCDDFEWLRQLLYINNTLSHHLTFPTFRFTFPTVATSGREFGVEVRPQQAVCSTQHFWLWYLGPAAVGQPVVTDFVGSEPSTFRSTLHDPGVYKVLVVHEYVARDNSTADQIPFYGKVVAVHNLTVGGTLPPATADCMHPAAGRWVLMDSPDCEFASTFSPDLRLRSFHPTADLLPLIPNPKCRYAWKSFSCADPPATREALAAALECAGLAASAFMIGDSTTNMAAQWMARRTSKMVTHFKQYYANYRHKGYRSHVPKWARHCAALGRPCVLVFGHGPHYLGMCNTTFRTELTSLVEWLKAHWSGPLVWKSVNDMHRGAWPNGLGVATFTHQRIDDCNEVAASIMEPAGIPILDHLELTRARVDLMNKWDVRHTGRLMHEAVMVRLIELVRSMAPQNTTCNTSGDGGPIRS